MAEIEPVMSRVAVINAIVDVPKAVVTDDYQVLRHRPTFNGKDLVGDIVEIDPTVPSWAKQLTKPTYTYTEVEAVGSEEMEVIDLASLTAFYDGIEGDVI